jgi:hypothetical protein
MVTMLVSSREWCGQEPIPWCLLLAGQSLAKMFLVGGISDGGFQMEESADRTLLWEMLVSYPWKQVEILIVIKIPVDKCIRSKVLLNTDSIDYRDDVIVMLALGLKRW